MRAPINSMRHEQNHVLLLTPPGSSAIAVIRISGPLVRAFLGDHFGKPAREGRPTHGELRQADLVIDDPVVVLAPDGSWADINVHGGPWIVQKTLDLAKQYGFTLIAGDVPLPETALDAETPIEREMLAWLPAARTELALRVLLNQPAAWEAMMKSPTRREEQSRMLTDPTLVNLLRLPRVALVGVPNAGKSTLANCLFAQERSIVADMPGTTRDWVGEIANIDGLSVMLIDTPGRRETSDHIERQAIGISVQQAAQAALVVLVLDASQPFEPAQSELIQTYPQAIVVLNKSDLNCPWQGRLPEYVATVASLGAAVDVLRDRIRQRFGCLGVDVGRAYCWTDAQRDRLRKL